MKFADFLFGAFAQAPTGGAWAWANGSTLNNTLVRLPNTPRGSRWNGANGAATWTAISMDNYTGVGSCTSAGCFVALARRPAKGLRNDLEIYPNPAFEIVQLRLSGLPGGLYTVCVRYAGTEYTGLVVVRWFSLAAIASGAQWNAATVGNYARISAYSVWWRFTKPAIKVQVVFTRSFCSRA